MQTAISGGSAIIMAGTLEFDASSSVNVNFDNSNGYGELILGNPEQFPARFLDIPAPLRTPRTPTRLIGQFTETGYSVQHIGSNQILMLLDAHGDVVTLTFENFGGTLDVTTSGGKTVIYDPPAEGAKDNSSATATAVGDGQPRCNAGDRNGTQQQPDPPCFGNGLVQRRIEHGVCHKHGRGHRTKPR